MLRLLTVLLSVLTLAACSSYEVKTSHDPQASFAALKTYAWFPGPQPKVGDPWVDNPQVNERIRRAVDIEMMKRGYRLVPENKSPSFLVAYAAALNSRLELASVKDRYGPAAISWDYTYGRGAQGETPTSTFTQSYEEGTLMLDVISPTTRIPIWRGTVQTKVDLNAGEDERIKTISGAVGELLDDFPPG